MNVTFDKIRRAVLRSKVAGHRLPVAFAALLIFCVDGRGAVPGQQGGGQQGGGGGQQGGGGSSNSGSGATARSMRLNLRAGARFRTGKRGFSTFSSGQSGGGGGGQSGGGQQGGGGAPGGAGG